MKKYLKIFGIYFLFFISNDSSAQVSAYMTPILAVDSVSSGNKKDVLTSFFNLSLQNLSGDERKINFSSNLFALMLKRNPDFMVDTSYLRHTRYRRINIDFNAGLDSINRFTGWSFGIKYAIIDKRDVSVSKDFISFVMNKAKPYRELSNTVKLKISSLQDINEKVNMMTLQKKYFHDSLSIPYEKWEPGFQKLFVESYKENNGKDFFMEKNYMKYSFYSRTKFVYDSIKNSFQNKPLWTAGLNVTSYDDDFQLSDVILTTEFLKGVINPNASSNLELDIKAELKLGDDTSGTGRDLNRNVFSGELGINWVLKEWGGGESNLEFKLAATENYILNGKYKGEPQEVFTMNGTLRFRISNEIWIPIEFRYDPLTGNVFGFINVTSNFTWLKQALKN